MVIYRTVIDIHGNVTPFWILQYFGTFTDARVTVKIHTSTAKTYQWLVTPGGSRLPPGQGCWVTRRLRLISHTSATDDSQLPRTRPRGGDMAIIRRSLRP